MDTDKLFMPLGDIFINTMEAEGELCELAGTEGHCSSRGELAEEREKRKKIRVRKHETDFGGGNGVGETFPHQL